MKVVDISQFGDSVVLYFDTEENTINAYTLASILVSIADAAKVANNSINPGHDIEIIVEALGEGSFKAKISALYSQANDLFSSHPIVTSLVIALLSSYIYERIFSIDDSIKVEVNTDEVIIENEDEKIIVPREVYDATREAERNPRFVQSIEKTFQALEQDKEIKGMGLTKNMASKKPEIIIPRKAILNITEKIKDKEVSGSRVISETVELQIVKAILDRGKRKWEFMWRGISISAPITSEKFYDEFFNHDITIAPGDSLKVKLEIKQTLNTDTGIYTNKSYEVVEVYQHNPRLKQVSLTQD